MTDSMRVEVLGKQMRLAADMLERALSVYSQSERRAGILAARAVSESAVIDLGVLIRKLESEQ